ncbi:MAG TPA: rhamnogalacturonan acetylesterase [Sphingomonas sp.]|nr:rhamnogalacturonan acetylesterase [Sphingomonas sp.]
MSWRLLALVAALAVPPPASAQRVFIASDSTAQDYPPEKYPQQGWGTMLRCAFDPAISVENRAIAARSTRSFINEGRLDDIARDIRAGDSLLIQFGHNDANKAKPERYATVDEYKVFLRRYIDTAARAGAQPVLLTPVTRRNFVGAAIAPSFPDYSDAVREVARDTGTPMIDLDTLSAHWVEAAGIERSKRYFLHYAPGEGAPGYPAGIDDDTHFSELGARGIADIVAAALARLDLPISRHVLPDRPALAVSEPTGGVSCDVPATPGTRHFRFAGPVQPGEVQVAPGTPYAGSYGYEPGTTPLFSVALPEGNYRVTVTLGDRKAASATTIKAEARRLMLEDVRTARGKFARRSFVVNIRNAQLAPPPPNAPGASAVLLNPRERGAFTWDDRLTLEFLGAAPKVDAVTIEPVRVPTLFLFGDSTVTDQRWEPWTSWGQMLPRVFGTGIAIANYAESGETLKSFIGEKRLDKALSRMRSGDFVAIQFGHNDQKFAWPQTYAAAATTYRAYLRAFVAEVRLRGATPLLVTPPERRTFTPEGKIRPTLADYAQAMRAVAAEEKVTLVDLNAASIRFYEALGPVRAPLAFADGGRDATHHNGYGAYVLAQAVAAGIRTSGSPLTAFLEPGLPVFDPADPILPSAFTMPASGNAPMAEQ